MRLLDEDRAIQSTLSGKAIFILLAIIVCLTPLSARVASGEMGQWIEIEIPQDQRPPARSSPGITFDKRRNVIVMHGGNCHASDAKDMLNDTWEFDGSKWTLVSDDGPARDRHGLAYDEARGITVLYGGNDKNKTYSDTWEWDGQNWTKKSNDAGEPSVWFGINYDPIRQQVIRHGGGRYQNESYLLYNTTYAWDGAAWTKIAKSKQTGYCYLFFDTFTQKVISWFANSSSSGWFHNPWALNSTTWERIDFVDSRTLELPFFPAMAYDTDRHVFVSFGGAYIQMAGHLHQDKVLDTTTEFPSANYLDYQVYDTPIKPPARHSAKMVYDSNRKQMVLFCGMADGVAMNDTWVYTAPTSGLFEKCWSVY